MGPICQHNTPSLRGALATKQSILSLWRHGLLRCARNDGDGVWSAACQRVVEVLPRHCEERLVRRSSTSDGGSDEAIHSFFLGRRGLLRGTLSSGAHSRDPLARKDVDGAHQPTRYSVIARSSCDEAIHSFFVPRHGLLRCARNDADGVGSPSFQLAGVVLPRHCEKPLFRPTLTTDGSNLESFP